MKRLLAALMLCAALPSLPARARAQAPSADKVAELERKMDVLSQELERLKLGEASEPRAETPASGSVLAPAASKVYRASPNKVSIGGYGELNYQNFSRKDQGGAPSGLHPRADLLRAVLYIGYKFSDKILFNSELEFEHAGSGEGSEARGEVAVEQAYMDFKVTEPVGIRAGHVLVPLGLVNEIHEPTTFHGANRPSVERFIIPSTWHENGVGVFGEAGPLSFKSYLLAGLHAVATSDPDTEGFTGEDAVRGGRASGSQTLAEDKAWASRVDVRPFPGALAGASLYLGEADQGLLKPAVPVTLWDLHATAEYRGAELRALYAEGRIGNAGDVSAVQGDTVARRFFGGYAEGAFNVLSLVETKHYLAPFVRYERYDTQWRTPGGLSKDPANSRVEYAAGLTYKPIPQVAVKLDQQWKRNQARTGVNQWNLALAYIF